MGDIMGKISAFDKDTMQELWSFESGTQFAGNPMTYAVNGKQYVALTLGGRPGRDEGSFPEAAAVAQNVTGFASQFAVLPPPTEPPDGRIRETIRRSGSMCDSLASRRRRTSQARATARVRARWSMLRRSTRLWRSTIAAT
jgi:hypothetical protein